MMQEINLILMILFLITFLFIFYTFAKMLFRMLKLLKERDGYYFIKGVF